MTSTLHSPTTGILASRTEALSLIVLGAVSALLGATPAKGSTCAIVVTTLVNVWAIISSVLSLIDLERRPGTMGHHLEYFLIALLILTTSTSLLTIIVMCCGERQRLINGSMAIGAFVVLAALAFGMFELDMAFELGCDTVDYMGSALCDHAPANVEAVLVAAGVIGFFGALLIWVHSGSSSKGLLCRGLCDTVDEACYVASELTPQEAPQSRGQQRKKDVPHSFAGAALSRASTFIKVCLLGSYWFLVDRDLTWEITFNQQDTATLWVTGQWAKQGVAIVNHFLNGVCT